VKLSFIVPAFNEEKLIEGCIRSIIQAAESNGDPESSREIIVVDNNSTDATAELAGANGATVVFEPINQISRARNTGAAAASGDWLIFIDADSTPSAGLMADVLRLIRSDEYIGCGSLFTMDALPLWGKMMLTAMAGISKTFSLAAGSFIVCRTNAFHELGGFSEELFAAEEIDFSIRLKKLAARQKLKFSILSNHPLKTSNRKLELYSGTEMLRQFLRLILRPRKSMRDRQSLDIWYDGRR
jgi:glycosyltransferase involved in cell wall biosynthesis